MSSIDVVDNVHCANLHLENSNIPIYWVQSVLKHDRTKCDVTPKDLMVGGGSGEHPALHIKNADLLPLWLLLRNMENEDCSLSNAESLELMFFDKLKSRAKTTMEQKNYEDFPYQFDNFMCIADWSLSTLGKVENTFIQSPIKDELSSYAEVSLLVSLAIFVMFDMPKQFFEDDEYEIMENLKKINKNNYLSMFTISSPLNSQKMGRTIKNGKVIGGYSLTDYCSINH